MRVLRQRKIEVEKPELWVDQVGDRRLAFLHGACIASDEAGSWHRAALFLLSIPIGATVAVLGGGFCILPQLLAGREVTVYELHPELAEFCPAGVRFVSGDWRQTLQGRYDILVMDTGETLTPSDKGLLSTHGVLVLGLED